MIETTTIMTNNERTTNRRFCSFPHGPLSILVLILSIAICFLVGFGVGGCSMIKHGYFDIHFGPLMRGDDIGSGYADCVLWEKDERDAHFDASMRAAMAFAILSYVTAIIPFVMLVAMSFITATESFLEVLMVFFFFACVFQALSFLAFKSEYVKDVVDGEYTASSAIGTVGAILAAVTAVLAGMIPVIDDTEAPARMRVTPVTPTDEEEDAKPKMAVTE